MTQHRDEAAVSNALRAASNDYGDLPGPVADRLDRVLDQLPAADTLHAPAATEPGPSLSDRLRAARVRYALLGGVAALLVVIGGVAMAVQYVSNTPGDSSAITADENAGGEGQGDSGDRDDGAAPDSEAEPEPASPETDEEEELSGQEEPEDTEEPSAGEESSSVETFATGSDYTAEDDMLTELRDLGSQSTYAGPPAELETLAEGGPEWQDCQDALAERYSSVVVAVDFAHYETEPAVVALLASDSGDIAVAVTSACGDGFIEELDIQQ